jgi:anti-sigma factor RsiW
VNRVLRCADCRELLGGYVLHALDPDEGEAVRAHLAACERCSAEHGELAPLPTMLDLAGSADAVPERPPAALEEAVLDRFAREGTSQAPRRRWLPRRPSAPRMSLRGLRRRPLATAVAGAAIGAAAALGVVVTTGGSESGSQLASAPHSEVYTATLGPQPGTPNGSAAAQLVTFSSGTRIHLRVHGLPSGGVYELWCLRDDGARVSAGTFRVDATGSADVHLTTAAMPNQYHRLAVERRPFGIDSPKRGTRVLAGEIAS